MRFRNKIINYFKWKKVISAYPEFQELPNPVLVNDIHLRAAIDWLCVAQDAKSDGGVSSHHDLAQKKWGKSYRETTGYIIETFINYFSLTGRQEYLDRAIRMGDFEIGVQCADGAFGELNEDGVVGKKIFNTGQIIIGLVVLFNQTKNEKYLESAKRAADWIVGNQASDGSFENFSTGSAKTYDARVAWPLLELHKITGNENYLGAARKNLAWILAQQQENFWFDKTSLSVRNEPWTHLIAYTMSGLLESRLLLGESADDLFRSAYGASAAILEYYEKHPGYLPGSFDSRWQSRDTYSCLTGNAQLAIVWMQIYNLTGEKRFLAGADRMIGELKAVQILRSEYPEIRGGMTGSYPIDGDYAAFMMINWAAKFFADALMLRTKISS